MVNPPGHNQMPGLFVPKFPGSDEQVIPTEDESLPDLALCQYYEYPPNDQFLQNDPVNPVPGYSSPRGTVQFGTLNTTSGTTAALDGFAVRNLYINADGTINGPYVQREVNLHNGVRMRPPPTNPDVNFPANYHDGITMTKRAVGIFSFSFNMTMLPSAFWALTSEYAEFKPIDVEVKIVPKFNTPWAASSNIKSNYYSLAASEPFAATQGVAPFPQDQLPGYDVVSGPESTTGYHALSGFKLKCWTSRIPLRNMNLDTSQYVAESSQNLPVANTYWSANLNRYMILGQTDIKIPQTVSSIVSRCPFVHPTPDPSVTCRKSFFVQRPMQLAVPGYYAQNLPFENVSTALGSLMMQNTGDFRKFPWITIPGGRGMIPGWFAPSATQNGKYLWPFFLNTPLCDFIVDTSDWTGAPYDPSQINEHPGNYPETAMNPGVEWDVVYTFRCAFRGTPQTMLQDIAQS